VVTRGQNTPAVAEYSDPGSRRSHERHHHPSGHRHGLQRVLGSAMTSDNRPSDGFAQSCTKDDVTQPMAILDQPRGADITRRKQRRPGRAIAEMPLDD